MKQSESNFSDPVKALRDLGHLFAGDSAIQDRLEKGAKILGPIPKLSSAAEELDEAADSWKAKNRVVLSALPALLALPVSGPRVEDEDRVWTVRRQAMRDARRYVVEFRKHAWARAAGPEVVFETMWQLTDDAGVAARAQMDATNAELLADVALRQAGSKMIEASEGLTDETISANTKSGTCTNECEIGETQRPCKVAGMTVVPHGQDLDHEENLAAALQAVQDAIDAGESYMLPGSGVAAGAIIAAVKAIDAHRWNQIRDNLGCDVHVVLEYQICVDGYCKNYWSTEYKHVKVEPQGNERVQGFGWRKEMVRRMQTEESRRVRVERAALRQCP